MLKGKNTIKLLALLGGAIAIYAVVALLSDKSRSKSFRESLVEIDTAGVSKIEIYAPTDTTKLIKDAGEWQVEIGEGKTKPARSTTVKSVLSSLQDIKPSRLAARSEDKWAEFQVDSSGTRVMTYEGGKKTLDMVLGKFAVQGQRSFQTFVRLAEDEDTYVADNFMKMSVPVSPDDYRDNIVLRLDKDSLTSIDFNYPDSGFALVKSPAGPWMIDGTQPADSAKVEKYLNGLSYVTSRKFATEESQGTLYSVGYHFSDQPDLTVTVSEGGIVDATTNPAESFENDTNLSDKIFKGPSYFRPE